MLYKLTSFRCPANLLARIDRLATATSSSRTQVLVEAARIFAQEVRARGGHIVPLFRDDADKKQFLARHKKP